MRLATVVMLAATIVAAGARAQDINVRVGLITGARQVRLESRGDLVLSYDGESGKRRPGPLTIGTREGEPTSASSAPAPAARPQWDVRATTETSRKKAELVRDALDEALRAPLRVERAGQGFAVLAGPFDDESRARAVLGELQEAGMSQAALVKGDRPEPAHREAPAPSGARLVAVTGAWDVLAIPGDSLRVASVDRAPIEVDGKAYRGVVEVLTDEDGALTVVNEVGLEDYLRGVVPSEMGPEQYPAVEALKAQAIAARTYALMPPAHRAQGFDRCAGPHCQVYGGVEAEHPLSDRAVAETMGLVLTHEGKPIHAYFSSTCGGHTEDVANVFADEAAPYLKGVECYPERVEFTRIQGRQLSVDFNRVDGRTAHGVLARLIVAGVVSDDEARLGVFSKRARSDESAAWLQRAAYAAGRTLPRPASTLNVDTAISFLRSVLQATGIADQQRLLAPQDLAAASRFREMQGLSGDDLATALLALKAGLLPEGLDVGWGQARLSRGNVLELLEGWLRAQGRLNPPPVRFVSASGGNLQVLSSGEIQSVPVQPPLMLLSGRPNAPQRLRDSLELKMGDRIRIHRDDAGVVRCIELDEDPDGASLDRTSSYSWWTKRIAFDQLQAATTAQGLGELTDLRITRVSDAGRVVGLEVKDSSGQTRQLDGFAVRQFLGLPDSRCDLGIDRDGTGRLIGVTATGRGWGHGVGLCQVGSYGLALLGKNADEILAHYYPGTRLQSLGDLKAE